MSDESEIIITSFVSAHLFWFIRKKHIILRTGITNKLRLINEQPLNYYKDYAENKMIMVKIGNTRARAVVLNVNEINRKVAYSVWLSDYGIKYYCNKIYDLPEPMSAYPSIAQEGGLYNVVNLSVEINFEIKLVLNSTKTLEHIESYPFAINNYLKESKNLYFVLEKSINSKEYGDIIIENQNSQKQSLKAILLKNTIMSLDEKMFLQLLERLEDLKKTYFNRIENNTNLFKEYAMDTKDLISTEISADPDYFEYLSVAVESIEIEENDLNSITIPTFITPQLFWIIPKQEESKMGVIEKFLNIASKKIDDVNSLNRNEVCAVKYNDKWARALLKDTTHLNGQETLICWLIDWGVFIGTDALYKLPLPARKVPPIARQASLLNVINLEEELHVDKIEKKFVITYKKTYNCVEKTNLKAMEYISKADRLYFETIKQKDNLFGDVILENGEEKKSLKTLLIEQNALKSDEIMFKSLQKHLDTIQMDYLKNPHNWS